MTSHLEIMPTIHYLILVSLQVWKEWFLRQSAVRSADGCVDNASALTYTRSFPLVYPFGPCYIQCLCIERLRVCFFDFLASSSTTRLYSGQVPRLTSDNFTCCHTRDRAGRPWILSQPVTLY